MLPALWYLPVLFQVLSMLSYSMFLWAAPQPTLEAGGTDQPLHVDPPVAETGNAGRRRVTNGSRPSAGALKIRSKRHDTTAPQSSCRPRLERPLSACP